MTDIPNANDDFYLCVNKSWLDNPVNKIPYDYSGWGGFIKLYDENLFNQIELVTQLKDKLNKTSDENKILVIWEASNQIFDDWKNNSGTYDSIAIELGQLDLIFENPNHIESIATYIHHAKMNSIKNVFTFTKGSDPVNSENVVLRSHCGGLSLPSREYYTEEKFVNKLDLFRTHLENVYKILISSFHDCEVCETPR